MNALEFSTKIEHGLIHLPKQFQEYDNSHVRIIVLVEQPTTIILSKKEKLLATFKKMQQNRLFENIENPVNWQKQLRDEWQ
jgi:GTP-binding protein EngB required for normal cell division